jgi:hypothetical protein
VRRPSAISMTRCNDVLDSSTTKKVLIIAYCFPPIALSGSLRPLAICHHLECYGRWPRVLTTQTASSYPRPDMDDSLCQRPPHRLSTDQVPTGTHYRTLCGRATQVHVRLCEFLTPGGLALLPIAPPARHTPAGLQGRLLTLKEAALERPFLFPDAQAFQEGLTAKPLRQHLRRIEILYRFFVLRCTRALLTDYNPAALVSLLSKSSDTTCV